MNVAAYFGSSVDTLPMHFLAQTWYGLTATNLVIRVLISAIRPFLLIVLYRRHLYSRVQTPSPYSSEHSILKQHTLDPFIHAFDNTIVFNKTTK